MLILPPGKRPLHPDFYELADYFGPLMHYDWCDSDDDKGHEEAERYRTNEDFVRMTHVFLYQNIGLMEQGIHRPYIAHLLRLTADLGPMSVIEVGPAAGQLGLALHTLGFRVSFADIWSQSLMFLIWRLHRRRLNLPVYVWDSRLTVIPQHDFAICFDVLEHLTTFEEQTKTLDELAKVGLVVMINLVLEEESHGAHTALDAPRIIQYIKSKWDPVAVEDHYPDANGVPRQKLVIYGARVEAVTDTPLLEGPRP